MFRQDTEEGGTWEGKRSGGWEKANKKRRNGESTYIDGMRPNFLLIFACLTVSNIVGHCTCIISNSQLTR